MYVDSRGRYVAESQSELEQLNMERARVIEESTQDVIDDFGEDAAREWAAEVELGLNDGCLDPERLPTIRHR